MKNSDDFIYVNPNALDEEVCKNIIERYESDDRKFKGKTTLGEREHENYGITHTIPYKFVDEEEKELLKKQQNVLKNTDSQQNKTRFYVTRGLGPKS